MKNVFKISGLVILICILVVFVTIGMNQDFFSEDVQIEKDISAFLFQDFIIVPEHVIGFHIQEWPIASYDEPGSIFEVQIYLSGQANSRGPTFDSYDKAKRVMLYLKDECGL